MSKVGFGIICFGLVVMLLACHFLSSTLQNALNPEPTPATTTTTSASSNH